MPSYLVTVTKISTTHYLVKAKDRTLATRKVLVEQTVPIAIAMKERTFSDTTCVDLEPKEE